MRSPNIGVTTPNVKNRTPGILNGLLCERPGLRAALNGPFAIPS